MARVYGTPIDMTQLEIRQLVLHLLASDPGSPVEGQLWYDTVNHVVKFENNAGVIVLGKLNNITAPDGDVSFNSHKGTNVANGTTSTDAVNKGQLDAAVAGLTWKLPVRAASTANGTLASAFENGDSMDGVTLATGDRILLKDQSSGAENGIYVVAASGAPARATDADSSAELVNAAVLVSEGTANHDKAWQQTVNAPITVGSTALVWALFGSITAGPTKVSADVGDGSSTSIDVTHSLGTLDVLVQVYVHGAGGAQVECDVVHKDTNTVTLVFAVAPTSAQYRVVIIG